MPRDDKGLFSIAWFVFAPQAPKPVTEYRFVAELLGPGKGLRQRLQFASEAYGFEFRDWRFDWAWPDKMVAAEVDGGQFMARGRAVGGRHNTDADRWKMTAAAAIGWRVLRFSNKMLQETPEECVRAVLHALKELS